MALFFRVSMAVVARDVTQDFNLSATQLGTLSSIFFIVYALGQIPFGILLDRHGGRIVVFCLGLMTVVGAILFALAPNYNTALAGRVLLGIGTSCVLMGALKIFTNWFTHQEFAVVAGFIMAIGNLGNLCATAPLAGAVSAFGWRNALLFVALLQIVATALVFRVVADAPPNQITKDHSTEAEKISVLDGLKSIFGNLSFWLLGLLGFCYYGNFMLVQGLWGGPYLMDVFSVGRSTVGSILFCSAGGFILGCLCIGKISTHLLKSRKKTLLIGQSITITLLMMLLGPAEQLSPMALMALFGCIGFSASSGVTIYPMVREMFPHEITGTALSTLNFFVIGGVAVVQLTAGIILDQFPHVAGSYSAEAYHRAFFFPFCGHVVAVLLFLFARDSLITGSKNNPRRV